MKRFCLLLAVLCLPWWGQAAFINGQNYVSLSDWAKANGFRVESYTRDQVVLANKWSRLTFDIDSAESVINGVGVRLSFPVAKGGLISQLDIDTTLRPLVSPQKMPGRTIDTICLDPGHGGKDTGNRVSSFYWHNEKVYTLALAYELRQQLVKAGYKVVLTRSSDAFVELPTRPAVANRAHADLFISLHFNAAQGSRDTAEGAETYCITPVGAASSNAQGEGADHGATAANRVGDKSLMLAYQVQKALVGDLHATDRDVRRARFAVLRDATMPAILIEGGYMSHPWEGKKIFEPEYRQQMAAAIVGGIQNYQKLMTTMPAAPARAVTPAVGAHPSMTPPVAATNRPAVAVPKVVVATNPPAEPPPARLPRSGFRYSSPRGQ
ncbi:MAG TPA: N-acetylmuramoyl-L-alanine amidase [Desulfuromonadaceae bacterium]|nr:N-acetylmuramoyl-L-alanine amidase [Desulfuromonadaceae bacterium]